jgi:hypothetical protein
MAQQRETATDRLVSVIASIKLERKSGQLIVRRGEGSASEEGILVFVQGQITQARAGRRNGSEAFNWLSTWRQARYIFTPAASNGEISKAVTSPVPTLPSPNNGTVVGPDIPATRDGIDKLKLMYHVAPGYEVPHTVVDLSEALARIDQVKLLRTYRRLYMLIDGRRSIVDLVPLTGKSAGELRNMLRTLEWLGVIRIANVPPAEP